MDLEKIVEQIETRIHEPPNVPFIQFIRPEEAENPTLKRMYKRVAASRKSVANIHQSQSLMPEIIRNHLDLYMNIMYNDDTHLDRRQKELIATVVSYLNSCKYCITHHYEALLTHWPDAPPPKDLVLGKVQMATRDLALISFAAKLTLEPYSITENDISNLRTKEFDDKDILNIILIISYFNFVNRLALGTGCPLERKEERDYKY